MSTETQDITENYAGLQSRQAHLFVVKMYRARQQEQDSKLFMQANHFILPKI